MTAKCGEQEFDDLRMSITETWDRLSTALNEARSEPSFSRFNDADYAAAVEELNHIKQRLLALCRDTDLYSHATVVEALVPGEHAAHVPRSTGCRHPTRIEKRRSSPSFVRAT